MKKMDQSIVELLRASEILTGEIEEVPPEGSLRPETYTIERNQRRSDVLKEMAEAQAAVLAEAWEGRVEGLPLASPEEVLVLASIVEKETGVASERGQVASVFVNRLKRGIKLQTDPTVVYGITEGKGQPGDVEKLERLGATIQKASLCGLGQSAPNPVLSTIKNFRAEYEEHIGEKRCRAKACDNLVTYEIIEKCVGCGACRKVCPVGAIAGSPKKLHTVDQDKCVKCGMCFNTCKFDAIAKV